MKYNTQIDVEPGENSQIDNPKNLESAADNIPSADFAPCQRQECDLKAYIENANFEDTGFSYTLSLISGKYKMIILYCLMEYKVVRFNELQRYLKKISDKTLSQNLKELENDKLIHRKVYPQIPPKVEYSLTDRGISLMKVLDQLCIWGEENRM